jgi:hypothetical protein
VSYINEISSLVGGNEQLDTDVAKPQVLVNEANKEVHKTENAVSEKKSDVAAVQQKPDVNSMSPVVEEGYAIQVLASDKKIGRNDSQFKSYRGRVKCYEGAGSLKYKYCFGEYGSSAEAQRNLATLRQTFKGAFVVHFKGDKIVK